MNISQLSRRNFLRSLVGLGLASLIPIKLGASSYVNDIYAKLGRERGIARRSLMLDYMPMGAVAKYVLDRGAKAWIGYSHEDRLQLIEDCGNSESSIYIPTGHYTVIASSLAEADEKLADKEDRVFFKLAKQAAPTHIIEGMVLKNETGASMSRAFNVIEQNDLVVSKVIMNPETYRRYFGQKKNKSWIDETHFSYQPERNEFVKNIVGFMLGAHIFLSDLMPENEILLSSCPEYIGTMPVRVPLNALGKFNIYIQEAGQVIINDYALLNVKIV